MSALKNESVDAIFSSHNIEHLYFHEIPNALNEFYRVIVKEGYVVITCPDLQSVCSLVVQDKSEEIAYTSPAGPISPVDIIFGHRRAIQNGNIYMAHKSGFTQKTLINYFEKAGFKRTISITRPAPFFDIWLIAFKQSISDDSMKRIATLHFT
jgi:predicted SAM-dependent methyltransferase